MYVIIYSYYLICILYYLLIDNVSGEFHLIKRTHKRNFRLLIREMSPFRTPI